MNSTIDRTRSAFAGEVWLGRDNPAAHRLVEQYFPDTPLAPEVPVVPGAAGGYNVTRQVFAVSVRIIVTYTRSTIYVPSGAPVIQSSGRLAMLRTRAVCILDV